MSSSSPVSASRRPLRRATTPPIEQASVAFHEVAPSMETSPAPGSVRPIRSLAGIWDFAFLGSIDAATLDLTLIHPNDRIPVPGAFDALPAYAGKRGLALYQTEIEIPPGRPAQLHFGAASLWSQVFVDGEQLREHRCGYTPFTVDVPVSASTRRTLAVLVDNRFDTGRLPMHEEKFDFYQYGGILREVTCHILPAHQPHLARVEVTPLSGYRRGDVQVEITLNRAPSAGEKISLQFDNGPVSIHPLAHAVTTLELNVPAPLLWSPTTPHLHRLRTALRDSGGMEYDALSVRFGLRRVEVRDGKLRLNGEPLVLRGYNRHEWHPQYGPCTPLLQMHADLQLLRDLGCNFVRGAHYPQDSRFLDLCDELGFLVFEENLGWQQDHRTLARDDYRRDHAEALLAMIRASYNHPCVILRGFLNEAESDHPESRAIFEESAALLRRHDPSRLVTYASDRLPRHLPDINLDLVDLVSINLYPGWYGCENVEDPLSLIAPCMEEMIRAVDALGFRDKPVLFSEIGAEGLYGWHDPHHDFFSEEYQAAYLATACATALALDRCCGIALWQFCDIRTYGKGRALLRPRTFNNKGTLDEYRRPKMAYAAVRHCFRT